MHCTNASTAGIQLTHYHMFNKFDQINLAMIICVTGVSFILTMGYIHRALEHYQKL